MKKESGTERKVDGDSQGDDMKPEKFAQMATVFQIIRFGVVAVGNNLVGYAIYLGVTWLWLEPKVAVTLMYPIAATIGYFAHARYAFNYRGKVGYSFLKYAMAHAIGFALNLILLLIFVDRFGYPHQLVQAVAIAAVGGVLYLLMRFFVFRSADVRARQN